MTTPPRPDLAAMQASIPTPTGPTSVDMQAAAQRTAGPPALVYGGRVWPLTRVPDMFDLGELGEAIDQAETNPIAALGAISRCLREWVADYPGLKARFRELGGSMDDYSRLAQDLFSVVAARPTEAPGNSSDGRTPTSTSSKDAPLSLAEQAGWTPPASPPE